MKKTLGSKKGEDRGKSGLSSLEWKRFEASKKENDIFFAEVLTSKGCADNADLAACVRGAHLVQESNNASTVTKLSEELHPARNLGEDEASHLLNLDKSRKGSVDDKIFGVIKLINEHSNFFTTSSCSGRTILVSYPAADVKEGVKKENTSNIRKKGCEWLYVTHDLVNSEDFYSIWKSLEPGKKVVLKYEAAILHVQCKSLLDAKKLVDCAVQSGFRNSGILVGKENKTTVAVRSAIGMEVPLIVTSELASNNSLMNNFIEHLNIKTEENWIRLRRLERNLPKC